jgi:hypothetical protein
MWTQFWDMHSGGGCKEPPFEKIYIEAPESEARVIFYNRFGHNPERVTCTCCGEDYSTSEHEDLAQLTAYHRGCRSIETPRDPITGLYKNDDQVIRRKNYLEEGEEPPEGYKVSERMWRNNYQTLEQYIQNADVLVIRADEIKESERHGEVPEQGYVWME